MDAVDPSVLLLPFDERLTNPPIGTYSTSHHLSLPNEASVTVRFDEIIYDGPGADFLVGFPRNGEGATSSGEPADIAMGPALDELTSYTHTELLGDAIGRFAEVDLADFPEVPFVQFFKVTSRTDGEVSITNSDGGFGFGGFQAINVLPLSTSGRRLRIVTNEQFTDQDFGRYFQDLPPSLLFDSENQPQAGQPYTFRLIANDDLGIASVSAMANGAAVVLDSDLRGSLTPSFAGEITVSATATDTRGQAVTETWTVLVLDENGELPFDPRALAEQQGAGLTTIKIFTPSVGEVPESDTEVIGSIISASGSSPNWSVSYAPIDLIDPLDLATPDSDYIEIGSGTGDQYSESLGTLPVSTLAAGIYFLKVEATPSGGGLSNLIGQVFGVGVDEASLRPTITFAEPLANTTLGMVQPVQAAIESERAITDWSLEIAAYENVDLTAIGGDSDAWFEIASGTGVFDTLEIASIDTSLLANGRYLLRMTAFNDLRLGRVDTVEVEVSSPVKPGRNRVEFEDINVELAGFPLQVTRVYDSIEAGTSGDFGYGWSFSLGDAEIFETVPDTGTGIFGSTPFVTGTRVFFTAPDGKRVGFTFEPEFAVASFVGALYRAKFTPDPGNPYKLEVPEGDDAFLSIRSNGEARLGLLGFPWNPDRYTLVAGNGTRYTYEQRLGLIGVEDPSGNKLTFSEDGITHSTGLSLAFTRDTEGRVTTITEPDGVSTWTYAYSAEGDLASVTDPNGLMGTYAYEETERPHFLTSFTNLGGRPGRQYEYDEDGRITAIIDERGNREEQAWDPAARSLVILDRRGNETRLVFDDRGNVTQRIDPLGNTTTSVYGDPRHPDLETEVTTENARTRFTLDDEGRTTGIILGDNFSPSLVYKYDAFGNMTERDEIGGRTFYQEYDELGRLIEIPDFGFPNAVQETRIYNELGQLESINTPDETLFITYDPDTGLKSRERTELGVDNRYTYDGNARLKTVTNSLGETTTVNYGTDNFSITYANGGQVTYADLASGATSTFGITDSLGETITLAFDGRDNETERIFPNGQKVERAYDAEDNLTSITVPGGHTETYTYDALNRPVSLADAASEERSVTYDAEGLVTERIDRNGKRITYTYNQLGQVTAERWHEGDTIVREFTFSYTFRNGFLNQVTDGTTTWNISSSNFSGIPDGSQFRYAGQEVFSVTPSPASENPELTARVRITNDFANATESIQYDVRGFLFNFRSYQPQLNLPAGSTANVTASVRNRYDSAGRLIGVERYNVIGTADYFVEPVSETVASYLPMGVAGTIRHQDSVGALSFPGSEFVFERDLKNRITKRTQPTNTATYTYDTVDQVLASTHTSFADESFSYDVAGNPTSGTYGADNRLLTSGTLSFAYDAEGNVLSQTDSATGEVRSYTYDHRNQLTSVSIQANAGAAAIVVLEYEYDYIGRPMSRTVNGQKYWLLYHDRTPVAEFRDGEANICSALFYDLTNPLAKYGYWDDTDGFRWLLTDAIGTVHGVLNLDGTPLHWIDYDTFGSPRTAVPADFGPYRFAGQFYNPDAGLYENDLRHYNPQIRRFQQQDPIRYESSDPNLYRYAENNPLSKIDPLGTSPAVEYASLATKVGGCLESLLKFSECVADLLGGTSRAIINGGGCVDISCVSKLDGGSSCVSGKPGPTVPTSTPPGFVPAGLDFIQGEAIGRLSSNVSSFGKLKPPPFCP